MRRHQRHNNVQADEHDLNSRHLPGKNVRAFYVNKEIYHERLVLTFGVCSPEAGGNQSRKSFAERSLSICIINSISRQDSSSAFASSDARPFNRRKMRTLNFRGALCAAAYLVMLRVRVQHVDGRFVERDYVAVIQVAQHARRGGCRQLQDGQHRCNTQLVTWTHALRIPSG